MAYYEQRQQAVEMAQKGYSSSEIAEILKTPIRNVQRWLATARKDGSLKRVDLLKITATEIQEATQSEPEEQEEIKESSHDVITTTLALLYDAQIQTDRWGQALKKMVNEHIEIHQNLRLKIAELLTQELQAEELSVKKIHVLSQALSRHVNDEMRAFCTGRSDMLTMAQASTLMSGSGFLVLSRSDVPDLIQAVMQHKQQEAV